MPSLLISELNPRQPIHLSGVAGSAMRGLAMILRQRGFHLVGTDPQCAHGCERLRAAGIPVYPEQDGSRIPADAALLVASAALPANHPELLAASSRGIRTVTYAEFLGALMAEKTGVAIAGTHGKTTVTAMVTWCLRAASLEPGFVIGGFVPCIGGSADAGSSDIFVAEACEYNRSFLNLRPRIAVITNIEADHLDVYGDLEAVKEAFGAFASGLPDETGVLVYSADCPNTGPVIAPLACRKRSFSPDREADYTARGIAVDGQRTAFTLIVRGRPVGRCELSLPGRHNIANALAAIAACEALGVPPEKSAPALADFTGVQRRFQLRGEARGVTVVDDYAHHPTEIIALIDAARARFPGRRIVLAFQPHQYSRTRLLMDDFAKALAGADRVLVPDIYFARDTLADKERVTPEALVDKVRRHGASAEHPGDLDRLTARLLELLAPGDVLLTAGAGDIDTIIETLLSGL